MIVEIAGAVLLWAMGTIAIALWFALKKLDARYDELQIDHDALLFQHGLLAEKLNG